ncbi:MAG: hypothetical protein MUF34_36555 [Polyangiaceae bacterium]|jgi:hypothetical protein|nr:hypothetical protein [Polyangiaceae bacterium]
MLSPLRLELRAYLRHLRIVMQSPLAFERAHLRNRLAVVRSGFVVSLPTRADVEQEHV